METILVIEDDEADQLLHEVVIKRTRPDIKIVKAFDGREALDMLASLDPMPQLILLDINMPIMNGYEFLEQYSQRDDNTIPIVAVLTTSDQEFDKQQMAKFPVVKGYLVKPLRAANMQALQDSVTQKKNRDVAVDQQAPRF
ncbi:response regulator [Novipirellula sp. SH528]|uniref:response regulator n=1 Tax=Novipirellula sp. SH528 TaxID=3454466 RepID=UPI003F9FCD65